GHRDCQYKHHQLCRLHVLVSSPCEVLQPDEISGSSRNRARVAKLTTDTTLQELDVAERSSSSLPIEEFQRLESTGAVTHVTLSRDFWAIWDASRRAILVTLGHANR